MGQAEQRGVGGKILRAIGANILVAAIIVTVLLVARATVWPRVPQPEQTIEIPSGRAYIVDYEFSVAARKMVAQIEVETGNAVEAGWVSVDRIPLSPSGSPMIIPGVFDLQSLSEKGSYEPLLVEGDSKAYLPTSGKWALVLIPVDGKPARVTYSLKAYFRL
ncbi:MAG: hypothetical protein ACF8SC_06340 [Phycisphaerales bacterium JB037]